MASTKSKVVFVGNIPYDMTEEQLIDIFKEVGPVVSFRLLFDRETGKARGYGFCEYADPETAASAIRNLNGYDVGGRTLRVDKAEQELQTMETTPPMINLSPQANITTTPSTGSVSVDSVNSTLASMTNTQLMEVMTQMKTMATNNPQQTKILLQNNPSLTFAIFQAMVMMNLIDPVIVQQVMSQSQPTPSNGSNQTPSQNPVSPPGVAQATATTTSTAPIPAQTQPSAEQQRALIMQILNLTPEQINALPPAQREQRSQIQQQQQQ